MNLSKTMAEPLRAKTPAKTSPLTTAKKSSATTMRPGKTVPAKRPLSLVPTGSGSALNRTPLQRKVSSNHHSPKPGAEQPRASSPLVMPFIQRKCACGEIASTGGDCSSCAEKRMIQRQPDEAAPSNGLSPAVNKVLQGGGGQPLPLIARASLESSLGTDLSGVRIHNDSHSDQASRDLKAQAFTSGQDIYFASGRYAPYTQEGQRLLAHEVMHTIQQGGGNGGGQVQASSPVSQPGDPMEREADAVAEAVVSGRPIARSAISSAGSSPIQRYGLDDFGNDLRSGYNTLSHAASDAYDSVTQTASSAYDSVTQTASSAYNTLSQTASDASDWITSEAGELALRAARSLAVRHGGDVNLTPAGLVIDLPEISLFDNINKTLDEFPPVGFLIPLLGGGAMLGPIPVAGVVGILGYAQLSAVLAAGPGVIRNIQITLNPITGNYSATAQLHIAAALGPRLTLFGGLAAAVGTVIPMEPPIPLVASIEGGLRGTGTGYSIGAIQSTVTLAYSSGTISFNATNDLMIGTLLQGDLDLFAAARIEGFDICHYAYRLGHWETGDAYKYNLPISASYGSGGGTGSIGPVTQGPIPVADIQTAIKPMESGWDCKSLAEIKKLLCDEGVLPPNVCEALDKLSDPDTVPGSLGFGPGTAGLPTVVFTTREFPNIAPHIKKAQSKHPKTLSRTTDAARQRRNRREACKGFTGPGSCDEYPFASTYEGGAGSSVTGVPLSEQNKQGGKLSSFYQNNAIGDKDKFNVAAK